MVRFRWLLLGIVGSAWAFSANGGDKQGIAVEGISFMIFDRVHNKVVDADKPPNDYGQDMDLLVSVKVSGPAGKAAGKVVLKFETPASSDAATGDSPATKQEQTRSLDQFPDGGKAHVLFIVSYPCSAGATFTATLGTATKSVKKDFSCAE